MKKILTILASLVFISSASISVSCTTGTGPMSRQFKQRVSDKDLKNQELNDLYIKSWNQALNTYIRVTPEEISSWEDANNVLKNKMGYYANRYITGMASDLVLENAEPNSEVLKTFRKIRSYYTIKANLLSTELETDEQNEITGILINVGIELVSPRDWEFLDSWVTFQAYLPLAEFGELPIDFLQDLFGISHEEEQTKKIWNGKTDDNHKPIFDEVTEIINVYDFASFEVLADQYQDLKTAKFRVKENKKDAEEQPIDKVKNFADFVEKTIWSHPDLQKYRTKFNLKIEFKMPNNDVFDKNEKISNVARFLSSSLIYLTASRIDDSNEKWESVSTAQGTSQMLFADEKIGKDENEKEVSDAFSERTDLS